MVQPATHAAFHQSNQTSFFATDSWVKAQRITGLVLMTLGLLSTAFAPATGGATAALATPLFITGSVIIGASLVQQSIGNAPNCEQAKTRRAIAGAFIMLLPFLGWIPGAILWHESNLANRKVSVL